MRRSCQGQGRIGIVFLCRGQRARRDPAERGPVFPFGTHAQLRGQPVKGVAMKRFAILLCAVLGVVVASEKAQAGWGSLHYGGYQPWWNIFAHRNRGLSCEEERLQRFWHDYYDALRRYYGSLDHIDWVAYYKNHGYQ